MSESFEGRLVSAGSKEAFRKAKHLMKQGELLCCMENTPGNLRAVFRDSDGVISRCEFHGFPKGPFSASCTCGSALPGLCPHAMAAAMYHAKYTIKYKEPEAVQDSPAQYSGLKFSGLPVLLSQMLAPQTAWVEINAVNEFPHVPSKWERVALSVTLRTAKREYYGNLNNLRQLYYGKTLAASLMLESFSMQDRQIIRFLANEGDQEGNDIMLGSETCAEFFHCLAGFHRFTSMGEAVIIHSGSATPLLLLEKVKNGGYILKSAIAVNDAPLPLNNVKVITGRAGCWLGMLGEYWWIPGVTDITWLRSFLRTTIQPCDAHAAQVLLEAGDQLPVRIVPMNGIKLRRKNFKPLYNGEILPDGTLDLQLFFDYGGQLCKADQHRLASAPGGKFWRRNSKEEFEILRELINFGFEEVSGSGRKDGVTHLILREKEAIGMFTDELIPKWLREKRDFLLSSGLALLTGNNTVPQVFCRVISSDEVFYQLEFSLSAQGVPLRWNALTEAAEKNEYFMTAGSPDCIVKLPPPLRKLARSFSGVAEVLPQDDSLPDSDILRIPRSAAVQWASAAAGCPEAIPLEFLRIQVDYEQLREAAVFGECPPLPEAFHGELRKYQTAGVYWLSAMMERGGNLILADEMGLGKTIQTLALFASHPELTLPAMVICPTSLVSNWRREAARFTPLLRVRVIEGNRRKELWKKVSDSDICICSYALIKRDMAYAEPLPFRTIVLDEAQHIKNPASANARSCKRLHGEHRLVLTGTPLENSAEDLWSIFDFLQPGLLGNLTRFRAKYGAMNGNPELKEELSERIAPFILRRKKSEVCQELPPKQEQILSCTMEGDQRKLYDLLAADAAEKCAAFKTGKKKLSGIDLLAVIMRLRQICCDPALLPADMLNKYLTDASAAPESAKMELFREVLAETMDSGHKVLVFSQFTSLLARIRTLLESKGIRYEYLDGSTKNRMEHVDAFNNSQDIPVFLLSLKAGGVGLNLTSADTVIICDPWWNPAAEDQAADRTHRIGQTKNVNCIKLVVKDSIEERVLALQQRKKDLFRSLVDETGSGSGSLTLEDFEFLLGGKDE